MKIICILIICSLLSGCFSTRQATGLIGHEKIVTNSISVTFFPQSQTINHNPTIELTIVPVDACKLDTISLFSSMLDGNYNKSRSISIMENIESKDEFDENKIPHAKRKAIKYLRNLYLGGRITKKVVGALSISFMDNGVYKEQKQFSNSNSKNSVYNPYKIDENRYYSLFSLRFKNKGEEVIKINLDDILLNSGLEQLYPLKTSFLENKYKDDINRMSAAQRLNMPETLILPPKGEVMKYVAFQPLNPVIQDLEIQIVNNEKLIGKAKFSVTAERKTEVVYYEEFIIKSEGRWDREFYVVYNDKNGEFMEVNRQHAFIPKNQLEDNYSVYGLLSRFEGDLQKHEYKFVKLENINLINFTNNHILKLQVVE